MYSLYLERSIKLPLTTYLDFSYRKSGFTTINFVQWVFGLHNTNPSENQEIWRLLCSKSFCLLHSWCWLLAVYTLLLSHAIWSLTTFLIFLATYEERTIIYLFCVFAVLGVHVENQIQSKTSIPFEGGTCVGVPDCHNLVCPPGMIPWCLAGICRCIRWKISYSS